MLGLRFTVCLVFDGLLLPWFMGGCGLIWWQYLVVLVKTRWFSGAFSVVVVYGLVA